MSNTAPTTSQKLITAFALSAALGFLYLSVVIKLGHDWWTDENYSHGLLVPFVIAFIIWSDRQRILSTGREPSAWGGAALIGVALAMLAAGELGAELFIQRISIVVMLAGVVIYLLGQRALKLLAVPFTLLIFAIPIPQIVFNRIAFPLQLWASQTAVWGIRLLDVPVVRKGNVIDILPSGSTQTISLEVVEACSGIRSLMTLVTLALILAYFTRQGTSLRVGGLTRPDLWRALILMFSAVPIAVLTNAARVTATGVFTFHYGKKATEATWHDASGWLVYIIALGILLAANYLLKRTLASSMPDENVISSTQSAARSVAVWPLIIAIALGGIGVNWFVQRGEIEMPRMQFSELPKLLGEWKQKGDEIKFDEDVESVLRTTDYSMRDYVGPDGRVANLYVGYYRTQRTGATYHSPQNCLPGEGWVMSDPQTVDIKLADGRTFKANRYIIKNGIYNEVMIYWYQGRGRTAASEYSDKINTVIDSVTRRRTDGAIIRVMTGVGYDEEAASAAAIDLSARLAEQLSSFVPD